MSLSPEAGSYQAGVRPRPRWLRALGPASPPESLEIAGVPHRLREVFKHDSWAATALYESPWGLQKVVKLHRQEPLLGLPMRWLGRRAARNERRILKHLEGLRGIPALAGSVRQEGPVLEYAVAREYVAGHPLGQREAVDDAFFPHLQGLLRDMHRRRTVYVDLHKRENIIVSEERDPFLIDFQISLLWPRWLPRGPLYRIFCGSDDYHLAKHWARCRPDQCGFGAAGLPGRVPWWIRAHRLVARPFREFRRRLLTRAGVRSGKGRVETEAFAESALRDINRPRDQAA